MNAVKHSAAAQWLARFDRAVVKTVGAAGWAGRGPTRGITEIGRPTEPRAARRRRV